MDQRLERTIAVVIAVGWVENALLFGKLKSIPLNTFSDEEAAANNRAAFKKGNKCFCTVYCKHLLFSRRSSGAVLKKL
ncbi:Uronate isomerase [Trichinella spiralis]|uniref:Uronate isomerase n=1 Tax=Trichinella spiralis TaxID=6334 RepID=A0ABR3K3N0_TRISP